MSATMARQGGRVQLEQSEMRLALNMAKMDEEGFSRAANGDTQRLMQKPHAEVREEKKWGVVFRKHNKAQAEIKRHTAMVVENRTEGCRPFHIRAAKYPQTS